MTEECHPKVQDPRQHKPCAGIDKCRHREQADHNGQQSEVDEKSGLIEVYKLAQKALLGFSRTLNRIQANWKLSHCS